MAFSSSARNSSRPSSSVIDSSFPAEFGALPSSRKALGFVDLSEMLR
jgi:hypothetical protein